MAFDGITSAAMVFELREKLAGGIISRIIQPERDELMITVKNGREQFFLLMSASPSMPLIYLTPVKKEAPISAPVFSMLLRKHIQGGIIENVCRPGLERVIIFDLLCRNELGDHVRRKLIIEIMGKHSNIILTDGDDIVMDSIKRIPASVSSVREVLPGRKWFIPDTRNKKDPLDESPEEIGASLSSSKGDLIAAITGTYTGISRTAAEEFLFEAGVDPRKDYASLTEDEKNALIRTFASRMEDVREDRFCPNIVYEDGIPVEYASFPLRMYDHPPYSLVRCGDVSSMLIAFCGQREKALRMRQRSSDLRRAAQTALDRVNKKYILQMKQLEDTGKLDKYRIYGEMINAYGYGLPDGSRVLQCVNHYTGEEMEIPLDPRLSISENAQKYFTKYNKMKRTAVSLGAQIEETRSDREQLESVIQAIDMAESEAELTEIRREMSDYGFIKKAPSSGKGPRRKERAKYLSFVSSDGFEMLVGKNNYQNDEISFKVAEGGDWWFHAKGIPGSHVIVRAGGREVPDRTFEEAASLAAYYSSGRDAGKVEIDYTLKKNLRKPNGSKPGFVIYHTNHSMLASPDISRIARKE